MLNLFEITDDPASLSPERTDELLSLIPVITRLSRKRIVQLLEEEAGIQCYDDESLPCLAQALLLAIRDGASVLGNEQGESEEMQSLSVWQERVESAWVVFVAHLLWLLSFVKLAPRPGYGTCIGEWTTCGYRFDGNGFPKYPLDWLAQRFERRFQAEKKASIKQNLLSGTVKWRGNELYLHWLGYTGCRHLELRFSNWADTEPIITYTIELTREQDPLHSGYYASDTEVVLKDDSCRYWSIKGGRQTIAAVASSLSEWHVLCLGNPCDLWERERA